MKREDDVMVVWCVVEARAGEREASRSKQQARGEKRAGGNKGERKEKK